MRVWSTIALAIAAGCGEAFEAAEVAGAGGIGGGGGPGASTSTGSSASAGGERGGSSTAGPGAGPASSSSSTGGGEGGEAGSSGQGGQGGEPCVPSKTCASKTILCGTLDDGCGTALDCGDYEYWQLCHHGAPVYTCDCPVTHLYSVTCAGDNIGSSEPPYADCIVNPAPDGGGTWCCSQDQLP